MIRLLICFSFCVIHTIVATTQVPAADSLVLVKLYNATGGPSWKNKTNWLTGPVSTWHGIFVENNQVLSIQFNNNGLNGSLPEEIATLSKLKTLQFIGELNLAGSLPVHIDNLTELRWFNIRGSKMTGDIPKSITKLKNLINLELHGNFTGVIPDSIGMLSELEFLGLNSNQLSGTIPQSLYDLKKIKYLSVSGNQLSGTISPALNSMNTIEDLYLDRNQFTGHFPSIRNLTKLRDLLLNKNNFTGNPDTILGVYPTMEYCWIQDNKFSGSFSPQHFNATKMRQILVNNNEINKLGDFSSFAANVRFSIECKENRLGFDDIISNQRLGTKLAVFPQKPLTKDTNIVINPGENYIINSPMTNQEIVYTWYKNGDKIAGTNSKQLNITFSPAVKGDYYFVARHPSFTDQDTIRSGRFKLSDRSTAIHELNKDLYKMIYQPSNQAVVISTPPGRNSILKIFATNAEIVAEKKIRASLDQLSVNQLPTGIYIMALSNSEGYRTVKFIKY